MQLARGAHPSSLQRFLAKHGYRHDEQRDELVQRIRSTPLLSTDRALIEPAQLVCEVLGQQLASLQKTIEQMQTRIDQAMAQLATTE